MDGYRKRRVMPEVMPVRQFRVLLRILSGFSSCQLVAPYPLHLPTCPHKDPFPTLVDADLSRNGFLF